MRIRSAIIEWIIQRQTTLEVQFHIEPMLAHCLAINEACVFMDMIQASFSEEVIEGEIIDVEYTVIVEEIL